MMRSMLNMLTGKPAPATTAPVNSSQLLSKKRKSSGEQQQVSPHEEEQTMEYSAMLKPKLLQQQQQANAEHDNENNSLLSNSMRSSSITLKSTTPSAALMKKLSSTTTTASVNTTSSVPTIPSITTSATPKEESPPKKQKLNSGAALPNPTSSNAPLPPMPPAIANMLAAFQLELDSRIERLRTTSEFQISSLTRSFKNELNKVPAKVRSLTLAEFLDVGKYEGDAALVMNESAMVEQNKLETWVAATPKLRTSRKHREMMMATPSHSALLATTQRLTRASARKLNPNDVTGLGIGLGETTLPGTAATAAAPAPVIPKINLSDAVYETPSAKNKIRARLAGAMMETKASAAVVPIASMSIASLMASAVKSGKKKLAPSGTAAAAAAASSTSARSITPEPMEVDTPAATTTAAAAKSSRKKLASSRSTRTKATESASERDSGSSTELLSSAPVTDVSGDSEQLNVAEKEEEEPESARPTRGRPATKGKTATAAKTTKAAAAKTTRGRKAAAEPAPLPSPVKESEKEIESPREVEEVPAPAEEEVAPTKAAPAKKATRAPRGTKKAAAKSEDEPVEEKASDKDTTSSEVSMEDIVLHETSKPAAGAAAEPKRVTRARAKKGDEPAAASGKGAVSKLLAGLHAEFNETVKNFSKA